MSRLLLRTAMPLSVLLASFAAPGTAAVAVDDPELVDPAVVVADLNYREGLHVVFFYSQAAQDYGLMQEGPIGRTVPIVTEPMDSQLAAYLAITPRDLPVPELLLAELPPGSPAPPELAGRTISSGPVIARDLVAPLAPMATGSCNYVWLNSYNWLEGDWSPPVALGQVAYYSSSFGGMKRFSDSFINNCSQLGSVRHRVYYKSGGNYHKQFDAFVPSGGWQSVHAGSVHRYRKILYDAGTGYIRQGRFHN